MKKLSIGVRLTIWYVAIFALGEFVFGAGMWMILRHNLLDIVDDGLESQVEDLKNFLSAPRRDETPAKLQQEIQDVYGIEHAGDFLQISAGSGDLIYRAPFLQAHQETLLATNRISARMFRIRRAEGQHLRFLYQKLEVNGRTYFVEIGTNADDAVETLHLFRDYLLMFAPVLLLIAALVGYWLSRRALSPVDTLVQTARSISGANPGDRLMKLETGDELQRLSDTLNEMLERIETAFRRITQFTADASHELRTPVSLIRTEAELALRRSRSESEYKESLHHILFEAERTTALIERLLELARADSGQEVVEHELVDLRQTVESIVAHWQQVSASREVEFFANTGDRAAFVMGDESLLRRLIEILLDNAFKCTPPAGCVRLFLEQKMDSVWIIVRDSGVGIAPEDQQKIFERFYRVDQARSRAQGGSGLGLAIAQWVVAQHRGGISVESRLGEGATFRVELPLAPTPQGSHQPA